MGLLQDPRRIPPRLKLGEAVPAHEEEEGSTRIPLMQDPQHIDRVVGTAAINVHVRKGEGLTPRQSDLKHGQPMAHGRDRLIRFVGRPPRRDKENTVKPELH